MLTSGPYFGFWVPKSAQNRRPRFFPYLTTFIKKCFFKKFQSLYSVKKNFKQLFTFLTFLSLHSFRPKNAKNLFFCGFSGFSCILPLRKFFWPIWPVICVSLPSYYHSRLIQTIFRIYLNKFVVVIGL